MAQSVAGEFDKNMSAVQTETPTFIVQIGSNGQLTTSQLVAGDLSSATLKQLHSDQRNIPATVKLVEAMIIRNLP
jgi:hypothetical protein